MKRGDLQSDGLPPDGKSGGDSEPRPSHDPDPAPELDLDAADELEIIDAALGGDAEVFSNLFERYRPDLYGFCLRRLDDASEAEDVVQEIFIRALKNLPNFDRSKRIWPWFATIALRLCTDIHRERSRTHYSGDIGVTLDAGTKRHESVLDSVIASEGHEQLMKSLKALPKRQRRALELYALEGLSYEDIAAAEGISVGAVELLLVRARRKMRDARRNDNFGLVVFPFTWLRWKVQRIEERIRPLFGVHGEGLSSICMQAVCLSTLAMVVIAAGLPGTPSDGIGAVPPNETVLSTTQVRTLQTVPRNPNAVISAGKPLVESQQSAAEPAGSLAESLADRVINPSEVVTPETTIFHSIMTSPNYESDHTLVASGYSWGHVLFVSHDGGASWKLLSSRLFVGVQSAALSPAYSQDRRVFTLGDLGLEQSDDGGGFFRTVSSSLLGWNFAISPSFGKGSSKILMSTGKVIFEYDPENGVTQPALLNLPLARGAYYSITYSPSYQADHFVFVSDNYPDSIHYRCKGSVCEETQFSISGSLALKLSPHFDQDGLAYGFTDKRLFVSNDGIRSFQDIHFPLQDSGAIHDMAISWNQSPDPAILVSVYDETMPDMAGVYSSFDTGRSWNRISIDVPGFRYGAHKLIFTPTGRLLATGGIACSVNQGQTWTRRCPRE